MDKFIEYAPVIIVIIGFLASYRIFVTPTQLNEQLKAFERELDNKFVHKDLHEVIVAEIKEDILDIKHKLDCIYNKIMGINE